MKHIVLSGAMAAALLLTAACSSAPAPATNQKASTNTANTAAPASNTAANTAATPAASANTNAAPAAAGAAQDFTLHNETGVEINSVYISPHDSDDWEEDILGRDTLPSGQNVEIKFNRGEKAAKWDLRVEDKEGSAIEWENLNLLEISKVTLHYKDKKATAEVE